MISSCRLLRSALALTAAGALAASCASSSSNPSADAASSDASTPIVAGMNIAPDALDPAVGVVGWNTLQLGIGETLTRVTRAGGLEPWLADSVERIDDLRWEVRLRPEVTFHSGAEVDAEAVAGSLTRAVDALPQAASLLGESTRIDVVDTGTVALTTEDPDPVLDHTLAHFTLAIADAEAAEADPDGFADQPAMTGPYRVEGFTPGQRVDLVGHDDHWAGPASYRHVEVRFLPDGGARSAAFLAGELDLAYQLPVEARPVAEERGLEVAAVTTGYQYFLVMNTDVEVFADRDVRRALDLAVDRRTLVDGPMGGAAEPARGPISPIFPFALDDEPADADPAAAGRLLDDAGWALGDDGVRTRDGEQLSFTVLTYPQRPELEPIGVAIQAMLEPIGVRVRLQSTDDINEAVSGPFDAALYATNTAPTAEPGAHLSTMYAPGADSNLSGIDADGIADALDALDGAEAEEERFEAAVDAQRAVLAEVPHLFLVVPQFLVGTSDRLAGYEPFPSDYYVITHDLGTG
jgi:peptide/nickel transport system substrate-binding protein